MSGPWAFLASSVLVGLLIRLAYEGWVSWREGSRFKAIAEEAVAFNDEWDREYPPRCEVIGRHVYAIFKGDRAMRCAYCEAMADVVPRPKGAA